MESLRSDGNAVEIVYNGVNAGVTGPVEKGVPVLQDGFFGITMQAASSGETIAIEIQLREHEILIDSRLTAAKGDILYLSTDGTITTTNTDTPFLKVTVAKDANDYVWGVLLPQKTE